MPRLSGAMARGWSTAVHSALWALQSVTICPIHKCPLGDRCPHCHSRFAPLRARALPGRCSICLEPLGTLDVPTIAASLEEQQYELWAAEAIGHLLADLPNLQQLDMGAALRDNLYGCLNQTEGATREYLSMIAGGSPCAFRLWATGESKPTLDHLCRLSYRLKLPLITLFQGLLCSPRLGGRRRICRHRLERRQSVTATTRSAHEGRPPAPLRCRGCLEA